MSTGTLQGQEFTTPGAITFNVPSGVTSVLVSMAGGGGGGAGITGINTQSGQGGGAAEVCQRVPLEVTSGGTVSGFVGSGGAGHVGNGAGSTGTASTFGPFTCLPGGSGKVNSPAGTGGGYGGAADPLTGAPAVGRYEGNGFMGGASGGPTSAAGGAAAGQAGGAAGGGANAGGGGGSTVWGPGAQGGASNTDAHPVPATSYGAGGGGSGESPNAAGVTKNGSTGANGYILVEWIG
jgi:hypothetical protein